MNNFRNYKEISFFSPERIRTVQQRLLRRHIAYCKEHSPFYRKIFKSRNIDPEKVTLDNLGDITFTDKADIENDNQAFFAVSPRKIADIVLSSGTTGKPTKIVYTESDLRRLAYNEEKSFLACGFGPGDVVLLTCTMDRCFVAGLAYYLGIRAAGATAVRNGLNSLASHAEIIQRTRPSAIVGVPSFLRKLGFFLAKENPAVLNNDLSKIVCIGEPLRGENLKFLKVAADLENIWRAKAYSTYSSSEIVTTFSECSAQAGGHLHPDLAVVEIIDDQGSRLRAGEKGEIVVTPTNVEGMPLVRFKTGDISFIIDEPCSCGRQTLRLGPILGRKKQMMKVSGTTIYPQTIYSLLEEIEGVREYYISVSHENELSDMVEVYLAAAGSGCTPEAIQNKLQARLRFKPRVFIRDEESIRRQVYSPKSRKPVRFIERR